MPTLAQRIREEYKEEVREEVMEALGPQLREEGEIEGMEKKAKEAALRMLKKRFDPDTIRDITGLDKSEIEKLAARSSLKVEWLRSSRGESKLRARVLPTVRRTPLSFVNYGFGIVICL